MLLGCCFALTVLTTSKTGEYLVDAQSSVEELRLFYICNNQHCNEEEENGEYTGAGDDSDEHGNIKDIRLPSSWIHSPAWSQAHVLDCLALR
jgi:hypothetical protein